MKNNSTLLALMSDRKFVATESSSMVDSSTLIPVEAERVEILEELSYIEERYRYQLELKVEQAFYQAGKALAQLKERELFRSTHKTFEAYCKDRFGFTRRHSDYLIAGAVVVENLQRMRTIHSQNQLKEQNELNENLRTIHVNILPTKLEQVKPLTSLKPDEQQQVWYEAVEIAHGKVPSGRIVKAIVEQRKEKPIVLTKDDCQVGDVFTLTKLEGKEKKYNGCSCIVVELRDPTVIVDVHNATLTVKPENLNKIDSLKAHQQLPQTWQRIKRLREISFLDRGAFSVLENLGKHTNLTSVEEGLLSWLEQYYGVDKQESES